MPGGVALTQAHCANPISQSEQRLDRYARFLFLRQLGAIQRIEHPARNGNLFAIVKSNDVDLIREAAQSSDAFDVRAVARMVPVFDSAQT